MENESIKKELQLERKKTEGCYLGGLVVLLLDALYLHLPEHLGLWVGLTHVTVIDDTWAPQNQVRHLGYCKFI